VILEKVKAPSLLLKALPVSAVIGHRKKKRRKIKIGARGRGKEVKKP
jgi:hypothetical protein